MTVEQAKTRVRVLIGARCWLITVPSTNPEVALHDLASAIAREAGTHRARVLAPAALVRELRRVLAVYVGSDRVTADRRGLIVLEAP